MNKYLPIGTVCNVKKSNKEFMIIGYYGTEFDGNIKLSDYIGCVYPEGLLKFEQILNFNHDDIEKIIFNGYSSSNYEKFNARLNNISGKATSNKVYSRIEFDENGVVIVAEPLENKKNDSLNNNQDKYEFDDNGTVISVSKDVDVENPFFKNYNTHLKNKKVNYNDIISNSNAIIEPKYLETLSEIKLNDDGSIITENDLKISENYKFDENGVVIKDGDKSLNSYKFDKNGVVIKDGDKSLSRYKFDENGVIIEEI